MSDDPGAADPIVDTTVHVSRWEWIKIVIMSIIRLVLGSTIIFVCLSLVQESPSPSILTPLIVIALTVAIYIWFSRRQIRRVRAARYPTIQAVEALVLIAVMFLAIFAGIYVMLSAADSGAFTEELDHFTAFYFALTVLATVGFGDITPVTDIARLFCMVQMAIDIVFIGILVKILGGAAQQGRRAQQSQASGAS